MIRRKRQAASDAGSPLFPLQALLLNVFDALRVEHLPYPGGSDAQFVRAERVAERQQVALAVLQLPIPDPLRQTA